MCLFRGLISVLCGRAQVDKMIIAHNASLYAALFCSLLCGVIMIIISVDGRGGGWGEKFGEEGGLGREIWGGREAGERNLGRKRGLGERSLGRKGGLGREIWGGKGAGGEKFGGRGRRKENLSMEGGGGWGGGE